jgi:hypothetical protein
MFVATRPLSETYRWGPTESTQNLVDVLVVSVKRRKRFSQASDLSIIHLRGQYQNLFGFRNQEKT